MADDLPFDSAGRIGGDATTDDSTTGDATTGDATARYDRLAHSKALDYPVAIGKRFFEIDGLDLGALLALELFTTVIPLALIGFSYANGFSESFSVGRVMIRQLHLTGEEAELVRSAFGTGAKLRSTWTVFGLASFLVWGIPMSSLVAKLFAKAWRRTRLPFLHEVYRGAIWFALFLGTQTLTANLTGGRPHDAISVLRAAASLLPTFLLWSLSPPILLRGGGIGWRHLAWCGLIGTVIDALLLRVATRVFLPLLLSGWVPFGPIGVSMTLMTWCTVIAAFFVVTACLTAVVWERRAPTELVFQFQTGAIRER